MSNNSDPIPKDNIPDFFSENFVNIAQKTYGDRDFRYEHTKLYDDINAMFDFIAPALDEMYGCMEPMDVNSSSCITVVNAKVCKAAFGSLPDKFRHLFATSLNFSKFISVWICAYLIPKNGDKTNPSN